MIGAAWGEKQRVITAIVALSIDQTACLKLQGVENLEVFSSVVRVPFKQLRQEKLPIGVIAKQVLDDLVEQTEKLGTSGNRYHAKFELKPAGVVFVWEFLYP
jgi:hypothetical protein